MTCYSSIITDDYKQIASAVGKQQHILILYYLAFFCLINSANFADGWRDSYGANGKKNIQITII